MTLHEMRRDWRRKQRQDMHTAPEVVRAIGVARRAEARESALVGAARLARRERRLHRRIQRLDEQIAGHSFTS